MYARFVCLVGVATGLLAAADIRGVVQDAQGGAIAGAKVELQATTGGTSRVTATNAQGEFRLETLTPGPYTVKVSLRAFDPAEQRVDLGDTDSNLRFQLSLQGVRQTVEVTAALSNVVVDASGKATGSRLDVPNTDLPVQVSAIPQQVLESQGVNDLVSAVRNVSGMSASRQYGVYEYYTIRGFRAAGGLETGGDLVLVDGLRMEGNRMGTQLNNVEQIEVLKGPSSVLYGGSALGGAINIIRKKPQATRIYDIVYRGGSFNSHQISGGAAGQVFGWERLLYRADVSFEDAGGWRDAGSRRFNVSPAVTYLISRRSKLTINQAFNRDKFDGDAGTPLGVLSLPGFPLDKRMNTPWDFQKTRDSQTQVLLNVGIASNFTLRDSFFVRYTNDQYFTAETLTYQPTLNRVDRQYLYFFNHQRPYSNQADLTGQFTLFGMKHKFLAGHALDHYYNFRDQSAAASVPTAPLDLKTFAENSQPTLSFPLSQVQNISSDSNGIFWQDLIYLTEALKVNVGGRYDHYHRDARIDPYNNGVLTGLGPVQLRNQNAYTYRAGLVYSPWGTNQFYASTSTSFQPVTQLPIDGKELLPETGRSYEIGHRWQGLNGRLETSLAFYRLVRNNVVIALGNQLFDQAGQQSSRGFDFDINGDLGRGLRLIGNYGYSLPRYDRYAANNGLQNLTGFRPRFTTKHAANLWLTKYWRSGITTSIGTRYLGAQFSDDADTIRLGGFGIVNAAVGYRRSKYEISVNADNLFNKERYFTASIRNNQLYPGTPFAAYVTLRFQVR